MQRLVLSATGATHLDEIAMGSAKPSTGDVYEVIARQLGVDLAAVAPGARLVEDLGADSLDIVQLVLALEERFEIDIPEGMAERMRDVDDVVAAVDAICSRPS